MFTVHDVAAHAGISAETVRYYNKVATKARRDGKATERDLPAPADVVDGANVWDEDEILAWVGLRKTPTRRGAIPKSEMRAILVAAENHQIDQVITIARRNLK